MRRSKGHGNQIRSCSWPSEYKTAERLQYVLTATEPLVRAQVTNRGCPSSVDSLFNDMIDHVDRVRLTSQNRGHQRAYFSSPDDMWAWKAMVKMSAGYNSWLVHQSSLEINHQRQKAKSRNGQRSENFAYEYLRYVNGYLTCRKILRHGASGFTSHPKEGVLRIFIALKNPPSWPGLSPRPFDRVASTLTTTPPRVTSWFLSCLTMLPLSYEIV
jgi:hypothetical protein